MALSSKQSQADDKQDEEVKYITSIDDDKSATKNNKIFTGSCQFKVPVIDVWKANYPVKATVQEIITKICHP